MLHAHRTAWLRVLALLVALSVLPFAASSADAGSTYLSNCTVNLRSRPWTSGTIKKVIATDTAVWASATVSGGYWKADCGGRSVSGTSWLKITSIAGHSVSSLFGVSYVYAAKGLFRLSGVSYGVDISHWQGWIDFAKVKAAGKRFVIAKATEGNTSTDAYYASNKKYAMANGLKFTGYHFARPSGGTSDAVAEADHFVNVLGLKHGMLVPVLDLEVSGGLDTSALQSWVKAFLSRVHYRLGVRAMIYTNASFWKTYMGNTSWFATNGYRVLWIAHWGASSPSVPGTNWGGRGWTFWQYSDCGKVSGISGCVDLDKFKGTDFSSVTY